MHGYIVHDFKGGIMTQETSHEIILPNSVGELKAIDLKSLKAKSVGMTLALFSNGERETKRLNRLTHYMELIEDEIFDETLIPHLDPEDQIKRYELAARMAGTSSSYLRAVATEINFEELESKVMLLENQQLNEVVEGGDTDSLQAMAQSILAQIKNK